MGTYYFQITPKIETWEVEAGSIIRVRDSKDFSTKLSRLMSYSDYVWYQNDEGAVGMIINRPTGIAHNPMDEEQMKQFMWVKLQATEIQGYA